jgi:hypothetical protein
MLAYGITRLRSRYATAKLNYRTCIALGIITPTLKARILLAVLNWKATRS